MSTDLSMTGVFKLFPAAYSRSDAMSGALRVLAHMTALIVAVAGVATTTVESILGSESVVASSSAMFASWVLLTTVAFGVIKADLKFAGYGLAYAGGLTATMAFGQAVFGDSSYFGGLYIWSSVIMAFVAAVVWLDIRFNRR